METTATKQPETVTKPLAAEVKKAKLVKIEILRPCTVGDRVYEPAQAGAPATIIEVTEEVAAELCRNLPPGQTKGFGTQLNEEIVHHSQNRAKLVA